MKDRVMIISHSYNVSENFKNIVQLSKFINILVIAPNSTIKERFDNANEIQNSDHIRYLPSWKIKGTQYLLKPFVFDILQFKPDIVNIEYDLWSPITIETVILLKIFRPSAKIILSIKKNTFILSSFKSKIKKKLADKVVQNIDGIISASKIASTLYRDFLGYKQIPIYECIHLGVDRYIFNGKFKNKPKEFTMVFIGQIRERKGILDLIHAMKIINNSNNLAKLLIVGDGPLKKYIVNLQEKYSWIEFCGAVKHKEIPKYLSRSSALFFAIKNTADHQEHDAHVLMEAMSFGLPCITTNSGVISDLTKGSNILVSKVSPNRWTENR